MTASTTHSLPLVSPRAQIVVGVALAALMIATRGQHFASIDRLPSASWAVFFIAGAMLRPMWMLPLLFVLASLLDIVSLASGTIGDWCLSPAYWALAPAYATLWLAGNFYARIHLDRWSTLPRLALVLALAAFVAYACSGGGFYFFSGRYPEPTLAGFAGRIARYYPRSLGTLASYVGAAFALWAGLRALGAVRATQHGARA
ncbi:cobalamin ABC transporter [Lysobacter sp. Root559]|uniref:hypothetical protein n=1 Tax=Lysobacter sp. Root559 TaxID=1736559 RepID=UPI0006FC76AC|nr:hypothetical protein [Lysobacter sp. Root559]KQZ66552.1 cobalamin ABC transporter [Lysobacter sp. Root559]